MVSTNNHSIGTFFKHRERLLLHLCSGVIYKFECESCKALYIGSTTRQLKCRAYEHLGTSVRSGNPLAVPPFSSIREHRDKFGHQFSIDNFKVLSRTNHNLLVMESLYIYKKKPKLNNNSPYELSLLSWPRPVALSCGGVGSCGGLLFACFLLLTICIIKNIN